MIYTVYILFSDSYNKHYTGFTTDLEDRLLSHNELGNGWTKAFRPWRLIYKKDFSQNQRLSIMKNGSNQE